ncbi:MAG TPA: carbohydrate ABC transporter permease, partial [Sediminispirochaeta sp.]|nr:carbohydrate ABC transporter permease [Sediminispirochaeta sp.]
MPKIDAIDSGSLYGKKLRPGGGNVELLSRFLVYAVLIIAALVFLVPFGIMINTSLKTLADIRSGTLISLPVELSFEPWGKAWLRLRGYFWNSVRMVVPAVVISTFIGAVNGYVLSKWRFPGSESFFLALLFGCFIPFQVILLPMSQTLGRMGLAESVQGLILVHVIYGIPFTTLFFRNYYVSIPNAIVESGKIDGAGFFKIFGRLILPISGPIIVVAVIWQTTQIWNDFLFGVSFAGSQSQPITVALNNLVNTSTGVKEYNVDMAGAIIAALPTLFVYIVS